MINYLIVILETWHDIKWDKYCSKCKKSFQGHAQAPANEAANIMGTCLLNEMTSQHSVTTWHYDVSLFHQKRHLISRFERQQEDSGTQFDSGPGGHIISMCSSNGAVTRNLQGNSTLWFKVIPSETFQHLPQSGSYITHISVQREEWIIYV